MLSKNKILINILRQVKGLWFKEIAYRIPNKNWPFTTKRKIDDTETVNRQINLAVEKTKSYFNKNVV